MRCRHACSCVSPVPHSCVLLLTCPCRPTLPPPLPPPPPGSMQRFWSVVLPFTFASPVGIFLGYVVSDVAKGVGAASISALASGEPPSLAAALGVSWGDEGGALARRLHSVYAGLSLCSRRCPRRAPGCRHLPLRRLHGGDPKGSARPQPHAAQAGRPARGVWADEPAGRVGVTAARCHLPRHDSPTLYECSWIPSTATSISTFPLFCFR